MLFIFVIWFELQHLKLNFCADIATILLVHHFFRLDRENQSSVHLASLPFPLKRNKLRMADLLKKKRIYVEKDLIRRWAQGRAPDPGRKRRSSRRCAAAVRRSSRITRTPVNRGTV